MHGQRSSVMWEPAQNFSGTHQNKEVALIVFKKNISVGQLRKIRNTSSITGLSLLVLLCAPTAIVGISQTASGKDSNGFGAAIFAIIFLLSMTALFSFLLVRSIRYRIKSTRSRFGKASTPPTDPNQWRT